MNPPEELYGASNGYTTYLGAGESDPSPRHSSANRGGIETRKRVAEAMSSSEFRDHPVAGIPVRRQGPGLSIGYSDVLEMLGFSSGGEG